VATEQSSFKFKSIAVPAFGPALLFGVMKGATFPVIALTARELGASLGLASLVVVMMGIGSLVGNIPAAVLTAKFGERRALFGAAILLAIGLLLCIFANRVWVLGAGVFTIGISSSVFMLARQLYLMDVTPLYLRARALSLLGGTSRIGMFIGPFLSAGFMLFLDLIGAYLLGLLASFGIAVIAYRTADLAPGATTSSGPKSGFKRVLTRYRRIYLTLGLGILLLSVLRGARDVVIPLWADTLGLSPAMISIVYGIVTAVDMSVFYPAGKIMDTHGRVWVSVPACMIMGTSLLLLPMTTGVGTLLAAGMLLGFGNGISSGLVMTLGADSAPPEARTQFLGVWRFMQDAGTMGGPMLVSLVTTAASLSAGIVAVGLVGFVAAGLFWRWIPRPDRS
jgi:MFS family permease